MIIQIDAVAPQLWIFVAKAAAIANGQTIGLISTGSNKTS